MTESRTYRFTVPRPPVELGANSRAPWSVKHRLGKQYEKEVGESLFAQVIQQGGMVGAPFSHGRLHSTHYFRGVLADADNCIAALKPIIDVLQVATVRSGKRYRLGLIEDDRCLGVEPAERYTQPDKTGQIEITLEVW